MSWGREKWRSAAETALRALPLALLLNSFAVESALGASIVLQGARFRGTTRPMVVVKTAATIPSTAGATRVATLTNLDTGAPSLVMKTATKNALGIALNTAVPLAIEIGGATNLAGPRPLQEDTTARFDQLNLKPTKTQLLNAFGGSTTTVAGQVPFDALGVDALIAGAVAIVDPDRVPVDRVIRGGASFTSGETQVLTALIGGATNPAIAATFSPPLKLAVQNVAYGTFGGVPLGPRPTVTEVLDDGLISIPPVQALWDTGAPFSEVDPDLIAPLGLRVVHSRVIIPNVTFSSGADTLTIRNLQAHLKQRNAAAQMRIGTNVLDQVRLLIDLHDDPTVTGPDRFLGLEWRPVFTGPVGKFRRVTGIAAPGTLVNVRWTDASGAELLDANNMVRQETRLVTGPTNLAQFVELKAPKEALNFIVTVTTPAAAKAEVTLALEGLRSFGKFGAEEVGEADPNIPAGIELTDLWGEVFDKAAQLGLAGMPAFLSIPNVFLDSNSDSTFDGSDQELFAAVDVGQFLLGVLSASDLERDFTGEGFSIVNGVATSLATGQSLPGVFFRTQPIQVDMLAAPNDPLFINPSPATGSAMVLSVTHVAISEPATLLLLACGVLPLLVRRARRATTSRRSQ